MSVADEQKRNPIISFETTAENTAVRLNLHCVSLTDWKPEYAAFRQDTSKDSSQFSEAWSERVALTLDSPRYGVAIAVSKHLEAALRALRSSVECQLGMKVWADALCINQADIVDLSEHVLRVKGIFSGAFSVTVWTNECDDIQVLGLQPPGERFLLCEKNHETGLEELLGVRDRDWGAAEVEDEQLMEVVEGTD
ncbi:hypothetical protein N7455_005140 [Penicillium solitum]|uniref:uncharacterized protein n=1 Tax=Penicillium solitum TaxID=60172 RepID=UPI0032C46F91|nr:hypothetical protein N7455_005140 [Penicillium solitum]